MPTPQLPPDFIAQSLENSASLLVSPDFDWAWRAAMENTGVEVEPDQYPWQIGLRVRGTDQRCGAILISQRFILTAAHCVDRNSVAAAGGPNPYNVTELEAFRSSPSFGERPVALDETWAVAIHDHYKNGGPLFSYDAALLRLAAPITDARPSPVGQRPFETGLAVASGWGDHPSGESGTLRAVTVPVTPATICRDHLAPEQWDQLSEATICTVDGADDSCARDSGGPLVVGTRSRPQTIGIVSWGGNPGCGVTGPSQVLLGAYTRTSVIAGWVAATTGDAKTVTNDRPAQPLMSVDALTIR